MKIFRFLALSGLIVALSSCGSIGGNSGVTAADSTSVVRLNSSGIAVVKMDSLMAFYGLAMDRVAEFTKKQETAQKELEKRTKSLEWQIKDFQTKAQKGQITTYQAQKTQEKLQRAETSLRQFQEKTMMELSQEERMVTMEITEVIMDYIAEYNQIKGYSMILQTMAANPVLVCDPAIDITAEILDELNARYEKTLNSKK